MATTAGSVRGTLETDPIATQGQHSLISIHNVTAVHADLRGNTSPLEELAKFTARDVNYNGNIMENSSNNRSGVAIPPDVEHFSIADDRGRANWARAEYVIEFSTEAFAQPLRRLSAGPHQALSNRRV